MLFLSVGIYDGIKGLTSIKTFKISKLTTSSISAGDTRPALYLNPPYQLKLLIINIKPLLTAIPLCPFSSQNQ
jgi:hypothetical protein